MNVTVALEIPVSEEVLVNEYLASGGKLEDRRRLLSGDFWARDYQDGRTSQAMFELIDFIRTKKKQFNDRITLLLLDNPLAPEGRYHFMALQLQSAIQSDAKRLYISLTGNLHNQVSMGYHLVQILPGTEVITLDLVHTGGTAWVCMNSEGCGIAKLGGNDEGEGVELFDG